MGGRGYSESGREKQVVREREGWEHKLVRVETTEKSPDADKVLEGEELAVGTTE